MTLDALYRWGTQKLGKEQIVDAQVDAWYLMEHVFHISRVDYLMRRYEELADKQRLDKQRLDKQRLDEQKLDERQADKQQADELLGAVLRYQELIELRSTGYPLQYILGYADFMKYRYEVNEAVLIPRADTEILVETAAELLKPGDYLLDMCTGSGCIVLSLAMMVEHILATGADISEAALTVAKRNRDSYDLRQVEFIQSDLFANIDRKYDMIVSNPPYIPTGDIKQLMREVRDYEPRLALDGSMDGLKFYRRIVREACHYLKEAGWLIFEIGHDQAEAVSALLCQHGYIDIRVVKDLAGLDRVVLGRYVGALDDRG